MPKSQYILLVLSILHNSYSSPQERSANLWIYQTTGNQTIWNSIVDNVSKHRHNITSISLCPYRIDGEGAFSYQDSDGNEGIIMEKQQVRFQQLGIKVTPLIDAHAGIKGVRNLINDPDKVRKFISDAVSRALRLHLNGYNLDIEISCDFSNN